MAHQISFIPGDIKCQLETGEINGVEFQYPVVTDELIDSVIGALKKNRGVLQSKSIEEIITVLSLAGSMWREKDYHLRKKAEAVLPQVTGQSPEMVSRSIDVISEILTRSELERLVADEFPNPQVLEGYYPYSGNRATWATGPDIIYHIFSGNLIGVPGIVSIVRGLLVKSGNLCKTSTSEPFFSTWFMQSIAEVNKEVANAVAILNWKGGSIPEFEQRVVDSSNITVVYGDDATISAIQRYIKIGTKLIYFPHKVSFAVIGKEFLTPEKAVEIAKQVALDVSMYDQQGCLSPHFVYAEQGGRVDPKDFAEILKREMENLNKVLPRGRLSDGDHVRIHTLRTTHELDPRTVVYSSQGGTDWTVVYTPNQDFEQTCLNRFILVKPVSDLREVAALISPYSSLLQTTGVAIDESRLYELSKLLHEAGVQRVTPIGQMHKPGISWHHDGKSTLRELVTFYDIER